MPGMVLEDAITLDTLGDFLDGCDGRFVRDADYQHTDNNYTGTDKDKLDGLVSMTNAEIDAICV